MTMPIGQPKEFSVVYYQNSLKTTLKLYEHEDLDHWVGCGYDDIVRLFCQLNHAAYTETLSEIIDSRGTIDFELHLIQIMHAIMVEQDKEQILRAVRHAINYMY
jgi:hypothetical protein